MLIDKDSLTEFARQIFLRLGTEEDRAQEIADHLVEANLKAHDSHGAGMIPSYVHSALHDIVQINADAELILDKGAVLLVDGNLGFGQVVGRQATDLGIDRVRETGIVCVGSRNNYHLGRIGTYGERCARAGLVSIHFVNVVGHPPNVSPWGGRDPRMLTNPFCCVVPTATDPIVLDMATSAIAYGKVRVAGLKGVPVPDDCLFDADGMPSNDPGVMNSGGTLGPFGKHKGYGLALMCELLGGGLAGEWTMQDVDRHHSTSVVNHMLMLIIDPAVFGGLERFQREVQGMSDWLHASKPAKGFDKVRLPGEPERESMAERLANGIPIDDQSWETITQSALLAGVSKADIAVLTA